jgi:hypothetical protein
MLPGAAFFSWPRVSPQVKAVTAAPVVTISAPWGKLLQPTLNILIIRIGENTLAG